MKPNNKLIRECSKVEHITFNDKTRKAVVRAYAELFQTLQKPLIILMTQWGSFSMTNNNWKVSFDRQFQLDIDFD